MTLAPTVRDHVDTYQDSDYDSVTAQVEELEQLGYFGDTSLDLDRTRQATIDRANPATAELTRRVPGFDAWLDLIPTAAALDLCYDPLGTALPNGAPITPAMSTWARNLADTRGIRSRAAVFRQLALEHADATSLPQRWLSLACGAAHPAISTARHLREQGGCVARLDLVDLDRTALALAETYAEREQVSELVRTHRMNVLDRAGLRAPGLDQTPQLLPGYDLVEAIGLLEYLGADDWSYSYAGVIRTRRLLAGARTFLQNAWRLVNPGGLLVVGNMLDTHPQLRFTLNVVQWPHIRPRPVTDLLTLLDEAGIHGHRRVVLPADGVYALYAVRKDS
ncbi:class I SAM-dependent methyltransferase [Terrabacter sp. NPDC080008]|uniref:SAM-dependent methyltransferase n=1 Tax=Terrabacter sp. NPDC080008 TaxID=3155176 RepID=UPI00344D192E